MAADLHIHVVSEEFDVETNMRCFYSNTLGSKWFGGFGGYMCEEKLAKDADFQNTLSLLHDEFPEYAGKNLTGAPQPVLDKWRQLMEQHHARHHFRCSHENAVSNTPNVWVGEVSWLKAALFDDAETFVPPAVQRIYEIVGEELPLIDDPFISKIEDALKSTNPTSYSVSEVEESPVIQFLRDHKGMRAFTISW